MEIIMNGVNYKVSGVINEDGYKQIAIASYLHPLVGWMKVENWETLCKLGSEYVNGSNR